MSPSGSPHDRLTNAAGTEECSTRLPARSVFPLIRTPDIDATKSVDLLLDGTAPFLQ